MRRRAALVIGWLAITAVATGVCAAGVSLVTSDLTEPRRDTLAAAELRSLDPAAGVQASAPRVHLDLATAGDPTAPEVPSATDTSRTFVSEGGVLVASCPAPVTLTSARPNDGFQVVVDDTPPGMTKVQFVGATGTEQHLISCGPDGVQVETVQTLALAAPAPAELPSGSPNEVQTDAAVPDPPTDREPGRPSDGSRSHGSGRPAGDDRHHEADRDHERGSDRDRSRSHDDGHSDDRDGDRRDGGRKDHPWSRSGLSGGR